MNKNKTNTLLILTILFASMTIGFSTNYIVFAENTAEPTLERIMIDEDEIDYFNFENNTIVTVEYSVDRQVGVDGVILVGFGSELDMDPFNSINLNYSYSLQDRIYYIGDIELTENSYFKGYGWAGDIANGTYEEVEEFNHLDQWHYLFVNEEGVPPEFHGIVNVTSSGGFRTYYAPANQTNHNIVISYRVYGGTEADNVTLVYSVYRDKLYNASLNVFDSSIVFKNMTYADISTETYVVFNTTIELTDRTLYFTANNSFGWDTWDDGLVKSYLNIYAINNGFYFNSNTVLHELITDVDEVDILITTLNSTEADLFGIGYYVIESLENDTEIVTWTQIEGTLQSNYTEENDFGNNDTIHEYNVTLGIFDVDNIIYFEAYNIYYGELYNETVGNYHTVRIYDSRPYLNLLPISGAYVNHEDVTFSFEIALNRGNITEILMDYGDGSPVANLTTLEADEDDGKYYVIHTYPVTTEGYNVTLTVSTSLGTFNSTTNYLYLDFDAPTLEITEFTNNVTEITNGYVELYFTYSDDYSGVWKVTVDWGDGVVQNATEDSYAFHYYVKSGTYTVIVEVEDKGGNTFSLSIIYTITLPVNTPTDQVPFAALSAFISILFLGCSVFLLKRRK
ncbi:MAG: PKD domain-containing protein [Candidatus Heimdallarchaeaceae archaeon]